MLAIIEMVHDHSSPGNIENQWVPISHLFRIRTLAG
jgi:hypothetical protein